MILQFEDDFEESLMQLQKKKADLIESEIRLARLRIDIDALIEYNKKFLDYLENDRSNKDWEGFAANNSFSIGKPLY